MMPGLLCRCWNLSSNLHLQRSFLLLRYFLSFLIEISILLNMIFFLFFYIFFLTVFCVHDFYINSISCDSYNFHHCFFINEVYISFSVHWNFSLSFFAIEIYYFYMIFFVLFSLIIVLWIFVSLNLESSHEFLFQMFLLSFFFVY